MDFSMIGSIRNYTKSLDLQTKWERKKKSGDVTAHMTERDMFQRQIEEDRGKEKLWNIRSKMDAGGKLTKEERDYLQANDPEAYQELENQEREQKAYEQALKRCKTKEDVRRLKASRLGASMARLKEVEHNPNIPLNKKLEICTQEKRKLDKLEESTRKFVQRGEYAQLPTENEAAKAEKEQLEAEKRETVPETEKTGQEEKPERTGKTTDGPALEQKEKPAVEQESPEARKVRRAKAKAAYASQTEQAELPDIPTAQPLDARG